MSNPTPPGYPGKNHLIPVAQAAALTARFRAQGRGATRSYLFDRKAFDAILAQPGCVGLRIYRAMKEGGEETVVIVGADAAGNDLLAAGTSSSGLVAEEGLPCPPLCSPNSLLEP